jgi:hypothetical protein
MRSGSVELVSGEQGRLDLRSGPNVALCRHVIALEKSTAERFKLVPTRGKLRRLTSSAMPPRAGAGSSASSPASKRGPKAPTTRFIVTNLEGGRAKYLYERL